MTKRLLDDFHILRKLEKLAINAVDVLNKSRGAHPCYEAGRMRKNLRKILNRKDDKSEEMLMDKLVFGLSKVAEYLKNPRRSFKSEQFKKLGDEIIGFLETTGMNITNKNSNSD